MKNKRIVGFFLFMMSVFSGFAMEKAEESVEKTYNSKSIYEVIAAEAIEIYHKFGYQVMYTWIIAKCHSADEFSFFNKTCKSIAVSGNISIFNNEIDRISREEVSPKYKLTLFFKQFCNKLKLDILIKFIDDKSKNIYSKKEIDALSDMLLDLIKDLDDIVFTCRLTAYLRLQKDRLIKEAFKESVGKKISLFKDLIEFPLFKILQGLCVRLSEFALESTYSIEQEEPFKYQPDKELISHEAEKILYSLVASPGKKQAVSFYQARSDKLISQEAERIPSEDLIRFFDEKSLDRSDRSFNFKPDSLGAPFGVEKIHFLPRENLDEEDLRALFRYLFLGYFVKNPHYLMASENIHAILAFIYGNEHKSAISCNNPECKKQIYDLMDALKVLEITRPQTFKLAKTIKYVDLLGPSAKIIHLICNRITELITVRIIAHLTNHKPRPKHVAKDLRFLLKNLGRVFFQKTLTLTKNAFLLQEDAAKFNEIFKILDEAAIKSLKEATPIQSPRNLTNKEYLMQKSTERKTTDCSNK